MNGQHVCKKASINVGAIKIYFIIIEDQQPC